MKKFISVSGTRGIRSALIGSIYHLGGVFLKRRGSRFVKKKIYGRDMWLDLEDKGICRTLWLFGERELDHKWILEQTLRPGKTVLDIGANIGYYLLLEHALIGSSGRIIAVEPSPSNCEMLKKNLELNHVSSAEILQAAVSNKSGVQEFWLAAQSNLNSFDREHLEEAGGVVTSIEVQVTTVRDLVSTYGAVDYVRMDIEGHEVEVLGDIVELGRSGFRPLPDVIFETHNRVYSEERDIMTRLSDLMSLGYTVDYVSSSSARGTNKLQEMGLPIVKSIRTDDTYRSIHRDVNLSQLGKCLNRSGGIRTIFLKSRCDPKR